MTDALTYYDEVIMADHRQALETALKRVAELTTEAGAWELERAALRGALERLLAVEGQTWGYVEPRYREALQGQREDARVEVVGVLRWERA